MAVNKIDQLVIIIPTLTPDEKLIRISDALHKAGFVELIVVDDGSDESCEPVFETLKERSWCHLFRHPYNKGKGAALKTAFTNHICRGGHYHCKREYCTPFFRKTLNREVKDKYTGFRVAIRPKDGYFYWDEWDEIADRSYAVAEGECRDTSNKVWGEKMGEDTSCGMNFTVCGNFHDDDPSERYFKIYDAWTYWESTKVIRIKFTAPEYQLYNNVDHKPDWILSEEEKVHLMELLTADDGKLWKDLIRAYNREAFGDYTFIDGIPEDLPIPDYTKLKYER